ncbi:sn-glycerol-3-phosphate ABC transporter ATP-binding protein UgpC [Nordella sp. HKS 07]|uniref:ABC transporter ATP-binding protein n=1 Tax=Nordella sp. HKS 07 TaxID=2712222 RepID=UPI0013E0F380|nr:sn-glycerol-3-phosphate ABC transporter ATP-binding protein UgpC [Nordella sp. HKS 07]QIG48138.1 sn-glycerol-3-phosphate ABC transporter ATP-binding protein UgpC [Nordella sp. HKS 07]
MASVELEQVSKSFGKTEVIKDMSLTIKERELVVFVGPSGCGKSTLLRLIAGLEDMSAGTLRIGGKVMNDTPAADRGVAMVFQSYALYPHMTVAENMGFALKMIGTAKAEIDRKVEEAADILDLRDLLQRKPRQLSGGQRQRVAIGRAIVRKPDVFLFDEPLSNLDAELRARMRVEIARLHKDLKTTMIYVTHDQVEAMTLADRIVLLNKGRIEQQGAPLELYEAPANKFVAGFLGQPRMNLIAVTTARENGGTALRLGDAVIGSVSGAADKAVTLGLRPDAVELHTTARAGAIAGRVIVAEQLGTSTLLHVQLAGVTELVTVEWRGKSAHKAGADIWLALDPAKGHLFDANGKRLAL